MQLSEQDLRFSAKINGNRIECGKCGELLEVIRKAIGTPYNVVLIGEPYEKDGAICQESVIVGNNTTLEIKCHARIMRDGKNVNCGVVNEVVL